MHMVAKHACPAHSADLVTRIDVPIVNGLDHEACAGLLDQGE